MGKPLRVLIVEDSEDDAFLVIRELKRGGYKTTFERVETAEAMTAALEKQVWDIIIADYHLPHFSAPEALELFHKSGLDLPFIVISGTVGEETAVATMKAGAHDYLMKGNLTRLVPAVERELREAEVRKERKLMQEALQITEQNFHNSLDNSPLGIRIVTAEGELLYANQAILDFYGYSSVEELKATPAKQRYTPESYAEFQERKVRRRQGKPVPPNYEVSIVRKDGEIRHLVVSRKEVVWSGEVQYQAMHQDITERKWTEEALWESERRYRLLAENAKDVIWTVDMNMRPTYMSPSITSLLGYSVEEAMALPMEAVYAPASFETAMKVLAEELAIENVEQKDLFRSRTLELELNRKDGSIVPVEGKFTFIRGPDGRPVEILAIARDITERKQAEEQTKQLKEYLQLQIDRMPIALIVWDTEFRVQTWNPAAEKNFGFTAKEALGKHPYDLIVPKEAQPHVDNIWRRLLKGDTTAHSINDNITKDGHTITCEWTNTPLREADGTVIGVLSMVQDITERKQAEEEMRESEEKYRQLFELGSDALFLIEVKTGKILDLNNAAIEMYGYSREEALQMKNTDFSAEPDKTRKATLESEKHIPVRYHRRKDGTIFPTDISVAYYTWYGKEVCVAAIRDTTERKRAVDDLRQAAEEWRTTFDSIADMVSIHDKDFRLVRVNKAFADIFNMKPEELVGKTCYQVVHGTNEPVPSCPHMKTLETKRSAMGDFFEPHLGIHLELLTSPIFDEKGEVVASVHVARDITERKKMEEQLIITDRLASIGELASGIAHELNNPLTGVIGFSELLLDKDVPDDVKEDLEVINREAKRTAQVVKNLLTFARKHPQEKQPVDINSIIHEVLALRAYEQRVNNIETATQFAPDLPEIMANGFELQQVFMNIIVNAEHFMIEAHRRGTLTITTERVGDIIRASFIDDGPGIAKENLGHLFDPFFTTKEVGKGTGLGLSISHGIVTAHGGRTYAESKLGKGATFVVELPVLTPGKGGTKNENS